MQKTKWRILAGTLAIMMLIGTFSDHRVYAEEIVSEADVAENTPEMQMYTVETADTNELLQGYLDEQLAGENVLDATIGYGSVAGDNLTNVTKQVYDKIKPRIQQVAEGNLTNTEMTVTLQELGLDNLYLTAADLGVATVWDASKKTISAEALAVVKERYSYNAGAIMNALIRDCPYEMYWFGNTIHYNFLEPYVVTRNGENCVHFINNLMLNFEVSADYGTGKFVTDAGKIGTVNTAIANAKQIAHDAVTQGYTDLEKLQYFHDKICELTDYNYGAASPSYTGGYGNPWQMIWVFDNNPDTTVVCEGYAKAFKYLCDLTTFQCRKISAYTMTGMMYYPGGSGPHMWNMIHMDDGKNYIVDLTNCDSDTCNNWLFIKPYTSGNITDGYVVKDPNSDSYSYRYVYDEQTREIFTTEDLTISQSAYVENTNPPITPEPLDGNFTNLIVFARFADESEFVDDVYGGVPVRQIIDNSYNTATYSVGDFYRNASADKVQMNSVYLYKENGSVQLPHERGYYASYSAENPTGYKTEKQKAERMYELRMDWSTAVNNAIKAGNSITNYDGSKIYEYKDLDKNGDGEIDSITVIYKNSTQNISVKRSDPLWNYKDFGDYVEIPLENGKQLKSRYYVQLTNTYDYLYQAQDNKPIVSLKAPIHEMGHIFGLLDLYNASNVSPVYYMSTMSNAISPVPQGISIKEKEALGWVDSYTLQEITQTGDYTLSASGTNGTQDCVGYKVNLPKRNKTLYLEYRNFSADGSKYDTQSKIITDSNGQNVNGLPINSGLVCYLANSDIRFPSNMNGKPGNWALEVLGGKAPTKSDAAVGLNQTLEIVDGISVCVTAMDKDTLTFHIKGDFTQHQHSGGVASCRAKAVCDVCGKEYGEFDSTRHLHTVRRGIKEATQQEYGFTGDLYCTDCNTLLEAGQVIDKLPVTPQPVEPEVPTPASYTVYYDANGGVVTMTSQVVTNGGVYGAMPTPARTGYQFMGWYTEQNGGVQVVDGTPVNLNGNQVLYARWGYLSGVEGFVARLYNECLDRTPDYSGYCYWINLLKTHQMTGAQVAYGFINSDEFKNRNYCDSCYVEKMYRAILGRPSDSAGKQYWVNLIASGNSREWVYNGFVTSIEFTNICNSYGVVRGSQVSLPAIGSYNVGNCSGCGKNDDVSEFVERLYVTCLNRNSDWEGKKHWVTLLKSKQQTGTQVAYGFVFSQEFKGRNFSNADYIEHLYHACLGRGSDPEGKQYWIRLMNAGYNRERVFYGFANSVEFAGICNAYHINR